MKLKNIFRAAALIAVGSVSGIAQGVTTGVVPSDGVYTFTFGTESVSEGFAVPASAVYDASHQYENTAGQSFTYGFLGTTADSYKNDKPWSLPAVPIAIDGFQVIEGQRIVLNDVAGVGVAGPSKAQYLPAGASAYEGRYPIRFAMSAETNAYYAVTCTVANVSATANADITLFSERCHIQAHHLTLAPNETRTFAWSVELFPNVFKTSGTYIDDAINVMLVGENAALQSLVVVKQPQVAGTVRGVATEKMNVGKTMWLCDDSTGTDQRCDTPYFSLQNYSGVGSGLSRYAPANLAIRNQGEGGLATNANSHRKSCMLKPGDYLYVEYGHNESSTTSYTNNLEQYFTDVNTAGANLIIVSPVERRSQWNSETSTWNRSLGAYATAGEAWVEDKIAQGATNVAFIDLNKRYNDWMNTEIQRIHAINPAVSLNAAISFYYRSAKGANVDNTHINNAGTDQAAYWVWYDARQRVAAGEAEGATESEKVQAAVLKGITEGYQGTVGLDSAEENIPWQISDEIINAGAAPNSFWDTPVTAGYAYVNDAVVSSIDATANEDGSVTLSGVTMRILNPGNYYKAVVEVVSADAATTNCYYSYYNYDVGGAGKASGDLVTPNAAGWLTSDKDKATVTAADCEAVTIPSGATATAWIAEADAGTWQVGANAPCSAKYPIEWWSKVVVDDDCADAKGWNLLTQAVCETNVVEGALYVMSSGAASDNTKKNLGFYRALDADVASGRYRISFKVMLDAGSLTMQLGDAVNSTTTLFKNHVDLLSLAGKSVTGYKSLQPSVTLIDGTPSAKVNTSRWVHVDLIVDRDNARASLSVGGSDYVTWEDAEFIPGSFSGLTWKYIGLTMPGQQSSYAYIDDVKIQKLAPVEIVSDKYTVKTWDDFTAADGMTFHQTSSDSVTAEGLIWANSANKGTGVTIAYGKYITFTPEMSGLLSIKFSADAVVDKRNPTIIVTQVDTVGDCSTTTNKIASVSVTSANTEYILTANLEAGKTYFIWPYSYNWSGAKFNHNYTIASIAYIYRTPLIITVDENVTTNILSAIETTGDVIKKGAGTLTLVANNSVTGVIKVEEGTLKIDTPYAAVGTMMARFDPTLSDTIAYTNGVFKSIADAKGSSVVLQTTSSAYVPTVGSVEGVLGGNTVFNGFSLRLAASSKFSSGVRSVFMVWHPVENDNYLTPMLTSRSKYNIQRHNSSGKVYEANRNGTYSAANIYGNGDSASVTMNVDQLLCVNTNSWIYSGNDTLSFGPAKECSIGEILVYSSFMSDEQRQLMETYLMAKWGIGAATYAQLSAEAKVSVAAGATLDLGARGSRSLPPTVAELTLAQGAKIVVESIADGEVVMKASEIVNEGATLYVGDEPARGRLKVVDNDDGTQSLVYRHKGLIVIVQ